MSYSNFVEFNQNDTVYFCTNNIQAVLLCPVCNGSGEVALDKPVEASIDGRTYEISTISCPVCDYDGLQPKAYQRKYPYRRWIYEKGKITGINYLLDGELGREDCRYTIITVDSGDCAAIFDCGQSVVFATESAARNFCETENEKAVREASKYIYNGGEVL